MGKRLYIIVLDGFGIGAMPDAENFGDDGANTLKSVMKSSKFSAPHMQWLGLFNIDGVEADESIKSPKPAGTFARLAEMSNGKDTTTGHWEIAGIVSEKAMPTFPDGFPPDCIEKLEAAFGRKIICNKPYSGTEVIKDYGEEHEKTGALIVYTSADSVLQIAAHDSVMTAEELYDCCRKARAIMQGEWGVGRVIARPFVGKFPDYTRTSGRHDFSLCPPSDTMLDALTKAGLTTIGIGKISDIFAGRGVGRHIAMDGNDDGMSKTAATLTENFTGLCFTNLVDFDMKYGHRRDIDGYAEAIAKFDEQLGSLIFSMSYEDILMVTADHGCDPGFSGSDHTREYVPLIIYGQTIKPGINLGTRKSFADIAASAAEMFKLDFETRGESFFNEIKR
ncbi:MAG: phosphopentomutase [Schwartzia sp.]|nr:phosphopentomutase [Schwartzia sp. (in: firmicutes)]